MHLQYQRVTHEDEHFPQIVMHRWGNERVYVEECEGYRTLVVGDEDDQLAVMEGTVCLTVMLDDLVTLYQVIGFYLQTQRVRVPCVPAAPAPAQDE
jgi:hypothetical protein